MKTLTITLTSIIAIGAANTDALAGPKGHKHGKKGHHHRKGNIDKKAENAALREEAILDRKDNHTWKKDPTTRDHRSDNLREYTNHTYKRIVKLLTMGALKETDGNTFKKRHTDIVTAAKEANQDNLSADEKQTIRRQLDVLNNDINAAIKAPEKDDNRTPIVNHAQHRFEELIAFGIRSGRLSTLEASSLRRKVKKLEDTEKRLKTGKLSSNERERLMKEVIELNRDLKKALRK